MVKPCLRNPRVLSPKQAVQDLCMHKMADKLYARLQQECDAHIAAHVASLSDSLSLGPVPFLDKVAAVWFDHCSQMLLIRQVMRQPSNAEPRSH